jgi:hypothetical protein
MEYQDSHNKVQSSEEDQAIENRRRILEQYKQIEEIQFHEDVNGQISFDKKSISSKSVSQESFDSFNVNTKNDKGQSLNQ